MEKRNDFNLPMIQKAAEAYIEAGISVLPAKKKDKTPLIASWKSRQSEIPSKDSVKADFSKPGTCIGLITGKVSGNLEILDFDFNAEFFGPWTELVENEAPGLIQKLVKQKTQNGGYHIAYRCSEIEIPGNTKLASDFIEVSGPGDHEFKGKKLRAIGRNGKFHITPTFIETRGEGGYFLGYPSPGYEIEKNRFSQVPSISKEDRETLINSAKALNKFIPEQQTSSKPTKAKSHNQLTPGDDFDERGDVESILKSHGWTNTGRNTTVNGDPGEHWRRPGKKRGQSATLIAGKRIYIFSSNAAPFEPDRTYIPFAIYATLEHAGDFSAAAKELSRQGYGSQKGESEPGGSREHQGRTNVKEIWGEPVDIFSETATIVPTWQKDYAPDVISEFGYDIAERMGVRPEQVIGPAIINIAAVIDDRFRLQPKEHDYTWSESARLNVAIIGESGSKKSPAKQQVDRVIKTIQRELIEKHVEETEALGVLDDEELRDMPELALKRVICGDSTIEGIRNMLRKNSGASKVYCAWDELSGWLGSFDTYRNTGGVSRDRAAYMELYEGGPKYFDRVNAGFIDVPNWSACIGGTITPGIMVDFFGKLNTDGLLQRFLLYQAEQNGSGVDRKPDEFSIERYETTIRRALAFKPEGVQTFKLSPDAQMIRGNFEKLVEIALNLPGATGAFKSHLNKYPGMFCRLTLTYHIADAVSIGQEPAKMVPGKIAKMAASALVNYHMPLAKNFYKSLGYENKGENTAGDLCGFILAHNLGELSSRDIVQNVWSLKNRAREAREIMEILEAYNWVMPSKMVANKTTRWKLNPAVHKLFKERAAAEKKQRMEKRAKILEAIEVFKQEGVG